jgi:hypothetical protein
MLYPTIDNPASCKICALIRFLQAEIVNSEDIHRDLCAVYGQNAMNEGNVKKML